MQGGFHVCIGEGHHAFHTRSARLGAKHEKLGGIAEQFQHHFHARGEKTSRVKGFQVRSDDEGHEIAASKSHAGRFQGLRRIVFPARRGGKIVVDSCSLESSGHIQLIHPCLRGQQGLSFFSAVIQDGFDKGFVGIRVRLFAHQGSVEPQIHLFEEGMADIVHRVQEPRVIGVGGGIRIGHQTIGASGIQTQFNFQITTIQIAKIVQGLHVNVMGRMPVAEGLYLTIRYPSRAMSAEGIVNNSNDMIRLGSFGVCVDVDVQRLFLWNGRVDSQVEQVTRRRSNRHVAPDVCTVPILSNGGDAIGSTTVAPSCFSHAKNVARSFGRFFIESLLLRQGFPFDTSLGSGEHRFARLAPRLSFFQRREPLPHRGRDEGRGHLDQILGEGASTLPSHSRLDTASNCHLL